MSTELQVDPSNPVLSGVDAPDTDPRPASATYADSGRVRVGVLGAGSWGTTFGKVLVDAGCDVMMWTRRPEIVDSIVQDRRNPEYLPGIELPVMRASNDVGETIAHGVDLLVLAVPAQTVRPNLAEWAPAIGPDTTIVSLAKGMELGTCLRMSQVIAEVAKVGTDRVAVLTGPNLAEEIAKEQPTATVIACEDLERARLLQRACTTAYLRPYTNTDVIGAELAGTLKNIIALACGMVAGMGMGDNTIASLITRGLAEATRLGVSLGADPMTFAGLAGLGDVVATCSSPLSRNRSFGELLGRGLTMEEARASRRSTAEGVASCLAVRDLAARLNVDMPLTEHVVKVCHEGVPLGKALQALMNRETKTEHDGVG